MPTLTRRRTDDDRETWLICFGDVHVGTIGRRAGVPHNVPQWGWSCGFYPGVAPRHLIDGSADDFEQARAEFQQAWDRLLPQLQPDQFETWRRERAWTAWKYAQWDAGCKLPSQNTSGRSRCFCGAEITSADVGAHIEAAHRLDAMNGFDS